MTETGSVIWAKTDKKLWPAIVLSSKDIVKKCRKDYVWVFWFGDHRISEAYGYPGTKDWADSELESWTKSGFDRSMCSVNKTFPDFVVDELHLIKKKPNSPIKIFKNDNQLSKLTEDTEKVCIGCYSENIVGIHPLFCGNICRHCKENLETTLFYIGIDNIHFCCLICGNFGDMIVCDNISCGRAFCSRCLENLAPKVIKRKKWFCYVCSENCNNDQEILIIRRNWREELSRMFEDDIHPIPTIPLKKDKIRVLSLFDGISSGLTALNKIGIDVEIYYASEIDQTAIEVAKANHLDKIHFLGDVREITDETLKSIGRIDLLIGGSPCNELSLANPDRKGLEDPMGTGILFFDYYAILMKLKRINNKPFFWLFENVASMTSTSKETIGRFLECKPLKFNAAWVSPQVRERFFWGNCPSLKCNFEDEGPVLQDFLEPGREALVRKLETITTKTNSQLQGTRLEYPIQKANKEFDTLTINELEHVFGFGKDYTVTAGRNCVRQSLIGKAWSIQTACMLLLFLKYYFDVTY